MWNWIKNNKKKIMFFGIPTLLGAGAFAGITAYPVGLFAVAALPYVGATLAALVFAAPSITAAALIVGAMTFAAAAVFMGLILGPIHLYNVIQSRRMPSPASGTAASLDPVIDADDHNEALNDEHFDIRHNHDSTLAEIAEVHSHHAEMVPIDWDVSTIAPPVETVMDVDAATTVSEAAPQVEPMAVTASLKSARSSVSSLRSLGHFSRNTTPTQVPPVAQDADDDVELLHLSDPVDQAVEADDDQPAPVNFSAI